MKFSIPGFIKNDFWRKAAAIFFAFLIWYNVSQKLNRSTTVRDLAVDVDHDSSRFVLDNKDSIRADVTFSGSERNLQRLNPKDVSVKVELDRDIPAGMFRTTVNLSVDNIKAPFGVRPIGIEPQLLEIHFDHIEKRSGVPVRVREEGSLPAGYSIVRRQVLPPTIEIEGPSKILREIRDIPTETVSLEGLTEDLNREIPLSAARPGLKLNVAKVQISYEVARTSNERAFHELPIKILSLPQPEMRLQVVNQLPTVSVNVTGPKLALESLTRESIMPFVQLAAITNPGEYRRPVHVWVAGAAGVVVPHIDPAVVDVTLGTVEPAQPAVEDAVKKNNGAAPAAEAQPAAAGE